jgi:hypothetical protein
MKRITVAVAACSALLVVSLASPAVGGPSIGSVAKNAKKALTSSTQAKRVAKSANAKASSAKATAANASNKADQALARPVVTAGGITTVKAVATIPAGTATATSAICPAGQRAISGGASAITDIGVIWTDHASDDRSAWIGGGDDFGGSGGTLTVYAYCAPAGQAAAASIDRAAIAREVDREIAAYSAKR